MSRINPWIAVVLIALAIGANIAFSLLHISNGIEIVSGIVAIAIAILSAQAHYETKVELKNLRDSLRPPEERTTPHERFVFPPESDTKKLGRLLRDDLPEDSMVGEPEEGGEDYRTGLKFNMLKSKKKEKKP
jgi:hypothetical protein